VVGVRIVGIGVGGAVGVAVGVRVGAAVPLGEGIALGAGVDVGADAGAQADSIKLTSKSTINVRFILCVLLWRSSRPTAGASAARGASEATERSGVGWKRGLAPDVPFVINRHAILELISKFSRR
jgi:hypothetical protein